VDAAVALVTSPSRLITIKLFLNVVGTSDYTSCEEGEIQSGDRSHANLQVHLNATSMLGPYLPGEAMDGMIQ
jgi:hypothetical protein